MKPFKFVPVKTNIEVTFTWDLVPCEHMYVTVDFHSRVESHENTPTPRKGAWVSDSRSGHLGDRKSHIVTPDYKRYLFKRPTVEVKMSNDISEGTELDGLGTLDLHQQIAKVTIEHVSVLDTPEVTLRKVNEGLAPTKVKRNKPIYKYVTKLANDVLARNVSREESLSVLRSHLTTFNLSENELDRAIKYYDKLVSDLISIEVVMVKSEIRNLRK